MGPNPTFVVRLASPENGSPRLRSSATGLRISDPTVSALHCELRRTEHGILVRDLQSTNGTRMDGRRVREVYADRSAVLSLGATQVRLTLLDRSEPVELAAEEQFGELVGCSAAMRAVFAQLRRLAATDSTVLITGETGTGKELAAAAVQACSTRYAQPFVVVDCGALPENLIESELLGHEQGAFTGAAKARIGAFERAHGGTIFLDEIGELPLDLQPALLGILERRRATRLGGSKPFELDVRVIAATNRDLVQEVRRGAFRADLYYRLAVLEVSIPPLRTRPEDIPLLVQHFLTRIPANAVPLSEDTLRRFVSHPWPGNVRELRNAIERALVLAEAPAFKEAQQVVAESATQFSLERSLVEQKHALVARLEHDYLRRMIEKTNGNISEVARQAGITRAHLYKLIGVYGIQVKTQVTRDGA